MKPTMKLNKLIIFALAMLISTQVKADFLGVYAGVGNWSQGFEGNIEQVNFGTNVDVEDGTGNFVYVAFEHPAPVIPNVKVQSASMDTDANALSAFIFNGVSVDINAPVELDLNQMDAIAYWEILDNWVSLDLGLALRRFDGELIAINVGPNARDEVSVTAPLAYGAAKFDLPFSGVYLTTEMMMLSFDDVSVSDMKYGVGYESKLRLGLEAGYRIESLEIENVDGFSGDVEMDGAYLALTLHI